MYSQLALDGLEQVVQGKSETFRRRCNINFVRYADDFIITVKLVEDLIGRIGHGIAA